MLRLLLTDLGVPPARDHAEDFLCFRRRRSLSASIAAVAAPEPARPGQRPGDLARVMYRAELSSL